MPVLRWTIIFAICTFISFILYLYIIYYVADIPGNLFLVMDRLLLCPVGGSLSLDRGLC